MDRAFSILAEAITEAPWVGYAFGAVGIAAIAALIRGFRTGWKVGTFAAVILGAMLLLLLMTTGGTTFPHPGFRNLMVTVIWFVILLISGMTFLLVGSVTLRWPADLGRVFHPEKEKESILPKRENGRFPKGHVRAAICTILLSTLFIILHLLRFYPDVHIRPINIFSVAAIHLLSVGIFLAMLGSVSSRFSGISWVWREMGFLLLIFFLVPAYSLLIAEAGISVLTKTSPKGVWARITDALLPRPELISENRAAPVDESETVPPRPSSQSPASAPVPDQVPDQDIFHRYSGDWINTDPETNGIPKIHIGISGNQAAVHVWGKCHPRDCDWGVVDAHAFASTPAPSVSLFEDTRAIVAEYNHSGFSNTFLILRLQDADLLRAEIFNRFTGSGDDRNPYTMSHTFKRQ